MVVYALIIAHLTSYGATSQVLNFRTHVECIKARTEILNNFSKLSALGCFEVVR